MRVEGKQWNVLMLCVGGYTTARTASHLILSVELDNVRAGMDGNRTDIQDLDPTVSILLARILRAEMARCKVQAGSV